MAHKASDEYKVGLFAAAGLLLFVVTVILLGGDKAFFAKYYNLKVLLPSVEGLNQGSVVQLSGLKVGNIEKLEFIPAESQLLVTLRIEAQFRERITEGSTAGVRTQGALGDKFIFIEPGPLNARPMDASAMLLTEKNRDLLSALATRGDEFQKIFDILNEVHVFAQGLNAGGGSRTLMTNMNQSAQDMKATMDHLARIMGELKADKDGKTPIGTAMLSLANIMKKIDRGEGSLGGLINDPTVYERLKEIVGGGGERKKNMRNLIRETIEKGSN